MVLHRLEAEREVLRDSSVTLALCDQMKYLPFACGEIGKSHGRSGLWKCGEVMDHALGDGRAEDSLATGDSFHRPHQFVLISVLEQVPASTSTHRGKDRVVIFKHCDHQYLNMRASVQDTPCSLDAIHARHFDIHEDHVRLQSLGTSYDLVAARSLADHLHVR